MTRWIFRLSLLLGLPFCVRRSHAKPRHRFMPAKLLCSFNLFRASATSNYQPAG